MVNTLIRLIATDIDGTLLQDGAREISQEFFVQAKRLMAQGMEICAASGRQYSSLRQLFAPIADDICYICENGAAVYGRGGALLSKTVIERETALTLCREILALPDCEVLISGANMSYLIPKAQNYVNHIRYFVGNNVTILPDPAAMPEDFLKISAYRKAGADAIEPILKPRWEGHFHAAIAGFAWLDFTLADKAAGIRALCNALAISPEHVMAFGDNYNDCPMLDLAGTPYIMENAAEPLRKRYRNQCQTVEGVLEEINRQGIL